MEYTFTHDDKPHVKERPRSGRNGRKLFTPKRTLDYQAEIAASYDGPLFEGLLDVELRFHPTFTVCTIRDWTGEMSPLRGDIDNYTKLFMDALEGPAYPNDRKVMRTLAEKVA